MINMRLFFFSLITFFLFLQSCSIFGLDRKNERCTSQINLSGIDSIEIRKDVYYQISNFAEMQNLEVEQPYDEFRKISFRGKKNTCIYFIKNIIKSEQLPYSLLVEESRELP